MLVNKVIVVLSGIITYLIATQMGAILDAMQKALSLAIGTSFIVIGGLLFPGFSSRKAGFWTIMTSIVSIICLEYSPGADSCIQKASVCLCLPPAEPSSL